MKNHITERLKVYGLSKERAKLLIKLAYQLDKEHGENLPAEAVEYLSDDELKELIADENLRANYFLIVKYAPV